MKLLAIYLTPKLFRPVDARSVCDSRRSCFSPNVPEFHGLYLFGSVAVSASSSLLVTVCRYIAAYCTVDWMNSVNSRRRYSSRYRQKITGRRPVYSCTLRHCGNTIWWLTCNRCRYSSVTIRHFIRVVARSLITASHFVKIQIRLITWNRKRCVELHFSWSISYVNSILRYENFLTLKKKRIITDLYSTHRAKIFQHKMVRFLCEMCEYFCAKVCSFISNK